VQQPDWWLYPERCANGHEWGPHRVLVVWQRCWCLGAQTLHEDRDVWGHFTVACREPGRRSVWYDPPLEGASSGLRLLRGAVTNGDIGQSLWLSTEFGV
jgi:hypothetical protein